MPLFPALQPENFIAGYFFVCFGSLEQRPVLTHGVADIHHSKICRFFPHKCFHEPLQGDSLWPLGAFVGTCTPVDPVPALIGL